MATLARLQGKNDRRAPDCKIVVNMSLGLPALIKEVDALAKAYREFGNSLRVYLKKEQKRGK